MNATTAPSTHKRQENINSHPCFAAGCHGHTARMHIAVAPRCNISCNYCLRKYDCVNESRPGVTSTVLDPDEALERFLIARTQLDNLAVVGIAGPGDPLANWEQVKRTFHLIREADPDIAFCLSTNGLYLPRYADEIMQAGVSHVTVTLNAVDPEIGAEIYGSVVYDGTAYRGTEGARLLLENQLAGIKALVDAGAIVKINTVLIDGINVDHVIDVARHVADLGATCQNINSMIPVEGSRFQDVKAVDGKTLDAVRTACSRHIDQIRHCRQCRADAVGELGCDISHALDQIMENLKVSKRIAVATTSGVTVDTHFGHARRFHVYDVGTGGASFVEAREADPFCHGKSGCGEYEGNVFSRLSDCEAIVCAWAGPGPREELEEQGIRLFDASSSTSPKMRESCSNGSVEDALNEAYRLIRDDKLKTL